MDEDIRHLELLAIFHYVFGALVAVFGLNPLIYVFTGTAMIAAGTGGNPMGFAPAIIGWFFIAIGMVWLVVCGGIAVCIIVAGTKLNQQKNHTFCLVVAAIECLSVPIGTILGVFTLVVLTRKSVMERFEGMPAVLHEENRRVPLE